jgi:hypothetical protein
MIKSLVLAAVTVLALGAAPVFSEAAHFDPAGVLATSASLAVVLQPGTRGDVVDT